MVGSSSSSCGRPCRCTCSLVGMLCSSPCLHVAAPCGWASDGGDCAAQRPGRLPPAAPQGPYIEVHSAAATAAHRLLALLLLLLARIAGASSCCCCDGVAVVAVRRAVPLPMLLALQGALEGLQLRIFCRLAGEQLVAGVVLEACVNAQQLQAQVQALSQGLHARPTRPPEKGQGVKGRQGAGGTQPSAAGPPEP
jgi:hypothetical protein